jgi:GR25 family glycosyltransferase involved in LPS biosynthesis
MKLNIHLIFSDYLKNRHGNINATLETIKGICEANNTNFSLNIIKDPSAQDIEKNIETYNKRVDYSKFPDENEYNNYMTSLNSYQISNYEKHRYALKQIAEDNSDAVNMIIEDDIIISRNYIDNINNLLLNVDKNEWDILFTSLNVTNDENIFVDYKKIYKRLLSKSCYFIKPDVAKKLYENIETFKLKYKHYLCKFINENEYKIRIYNKNTFIEGSKLGIYTTSINPNNYLYFNNNYIELSKLSSKDYITNDELNKAVEIFNSNNFESPDFLNVISVLYAKNKDYVNAKIIAEKALLCSIKNFGYLQKNSEILNNSINIWQYDQEMLEECKKNTPKYA